MKNTKEPWGYYQNAIISLIDILGFSDLIAQSSKHRIGTSKIWKIIRHLNLFSTSNKNYKTHQFSFSDSLIRIKIYKRKNELINKLKYELLSVAELQRLFIDIRILLRGVITKGQIFIDCYNDQNQYGPIIFGPGYIKAIKLEKNALFPRIIVDNKLTEYLNDDKTEIIIKDEDGKYYLNYLKHHEGENIGYWEKTLRDHEELIKKNRIEIPKSKSPSKALSKQLWLEKYHKTIKDKNILL